MLQGPQLVTAEWLAQAYSDSLDWLRALDTAPEQLEAYIAAAKSQRLGIRFERLLGFWLQYHPRFVLRACNVQVRGHVRTLGELDFVFTDLATSQTLHWETAVKFYLAWPEAAPSEWMGPSGRDTLNRKGQHALQKQLTLPQTAEGQQALAKHGIAELESQLLVKGLLFHHAPKKLPTLGISAQLHPQRERGTWCRMEEAEALLPAGQYALLERKQWLGKWQSSQQAQVLNREGMLARCSAVQHQQPTCWVRVAQTKGVWIEEERWFIAPAGWPHLMQ